MTDVVQQQTSKFTDFSSTPIDCALGIEIRNIDLRQLEDTGFKSIYNLWLENLLVVCRGQSLDLTDLVTLARRFGTPVSSSRMHGRRLTERAAHELYDLPPEITMISNVKEDGRELGVLGDTDVVWHSDFSFKERPTAARMLMAAEVPPANAGGDTYFLNCYAAYDALSAAQKKRITGKTIKQTNIFDATMKLRPGATPVSDLRDTPGPSHPIISTHPETGANLLFLGRRHGAFVNGCSIDESEALLDELWAHGTQPRFTYTHQWAVGDIVIWDNRATLHRRDAFNPTKRRILYAAQVEGHRPVEAPDALSRDAHSR